jgi:hypothetical protein
VIGTELQRRCNSAYPLLEVLPIEICSHYITTVGCTGFACTISNQEETRGLPRSQSPNRQPGSRSKLRLRVGRPALIFCIRTHRRVTESVPVCRVVVVRALREGYEDGGVVHLVAQRDVSLYIRTSLLTPQAYFQILLRNTDQARRLQSTLLWH